MWRNTKLPEEFRPHYPRRSLPLKYLATKENCGSISVPATTGSGSCTPTTLTASWLMKWVSARRIRPWPLSFLPTNGTRLAEPGHLPDVRAGPLGIQISFVRAGNNDSPLYGKERNNLLAGNLPPVMVTTYSILSRDAEALANVQWNYVVLDEAQKIKNHNTRMCKAAKLLNAKRRLALTGTPIENRLSELWSIYDFLMPGYLGSADDFRRRYETPITKYQDSAKREMLKKVIHPFKLRRPQRTSLPSFRQRPKRSGTAPCSRCRSSCTVI